MTSLRALRSQALENAPQAGKSLAGPKARLRAALGDIGNNAALTQLLQAPEADTTKPLKPARNLSKQKATSSLLAHTDVLAPVVSTRVGPHTRSKSTGTPEPMEIVDHTVLPSPGLMEVDTTQAPSLKPASVEDIDEDDRDNPQLAAEYVNEIYAYMRHLEAKQAVQENYLAKLGGRLVIKPKMRNLLVDWMVDVHTQFSLLQETLFLSVAILDRFLQVKANTLTTKQLQLVGVSAMFLASKYEEMYPPEIGDFVYITDKAYTESQIRKMEILIIDTLNFEFGRPLPLNFLRRNSKAGFVDAQAHTLAKYIMELSLVEYRLAHVAPSILAAASLAFAMRVLDTSNSSLNELWTPTLVHYTSYTLVEISATLASLAELVDGVNEEDNLVNEASKKKLRAVKTKYSGRKFAKIALLPQLQDECVKDMVIGVL